MNKVIKRWLFLDFSWQAAIVCIILGIKSLSRISNPRINTFSFEPLVPFSFTVLLLVIWAYNKFFQKGRER